MRAPGSSACVGVARGIAIEGAGVAASPAETTRRRTRGMKVWARLCREMAGGVLPEMAVEGAAAIGRGRVPSCQPANSASSWRKTASRRARMRENKGARNGARIAAAANAACSPSASSVVAVPMVFMKVYIVAFYVRFKGKIQNEGKKIEDGKRASGGKGPGAP